MAVSESVGGGMTNLVSSNAPLLRLYYISSKLLSDKDQYNNFQVHFPKSKEISLHFSWLFVLCLHVCIPTSTIQLFYLPYTCLVGRIN